MLVGTMVGLWDLLGMEELWVRVAGEGCGFAGLWCWLDLRAQVADWSCRLELRAPVAACCCGLELRLYSPFLKIHQVSKKVDQN